MELEHIVQRYAEAIQAIDLMEQPVRANPRTGEIYLPGAKSLSESALVSAIDSWWFSQYPEEFHGSKSKRVGVPYPEIKRTNCDQVIPEQRNDEFAWAIEVKNIALVGNNGKKNDFSVSKMLSPFLKDRSLLHDVARLRTYSLAARHAVIGYSFNYSGDTCDQAAEIHPQHTVAIDNIRQVCIANGGSLSIEPLLEFADGIMRVRGLITGPLVKRDFAAWEHPCGGRGVVFGWEVRRPEKDVGFDPRHPW